MVSKVAFTHERSCPGKLFLAQLFSGAGYTRSVNKPSPFFSKAHDLSEHQLKATAVKAYPQRKSLIEGGKWIADIAEVWNENKMGQEESRRNIPPLK